MTIVKTCKKHGALTMEQLRSHFSSVNGKTYLDCVQCDREWKNKNKAKINARRNVRRKEIYVSTRKKFPDGFVKECKRHGYLTIDQVKTPGNNGVKYECIQCRKSYDQKSDQARSNETTDLNDNYVAKLIQEMGGRRNKKKPILSVTEIKKIPELLEIKRIAVKIKRHLKAIRDATPKVECTFEHSKVNIRKAIAASTAARQAKTHCKNGHPFNESRKCKICNTENKRKRDGRLSRELAAVTLVDTKCSKCGGAMKVSKLGKRCDQRCQECKKAYMRDYDAKRGRNEKV